MENHETKTVFLSEFLKVEISPDNIVQYLELMGNRWVRLGSAERWDNNLIAEEFDI